MPAAAVIPAPIAYIKVVAVKKLVVGSLVGARVWFCRGAVTGRVPPACRGRSTPGALSWVAGVVGRFTLKKLVCSRQAGYA